MPNRMSSSPTRNYARNTPIHSNRNSSSNLNSTATAIQQQQRQTVSNDLDINKLASNYSNRASTNSVERTTAIVEMERMRDELITSIKSAKDSQIDPHNDRYPCCLVWTPLPLITWLIPFIGHVGICTVNGIIRDFAGPYFVSV